MEPIHSVRWLRVRIDESPGYNGWAATTFTTHGYQHRENTVSELARIMEYGRCHEDVARKGESQPCDKTAVAVRIDPEDGGPYPVCAYHARGQMVPLTDLRDSLT